MRKSLPVFSAQYTIGIICEGDEEYDYIEKLKSLNVWSAQYRVMAFNALGNGNIPARYQDKYQNNVCDALFIFCDTDRKPYEQYEEIKAKINNFHGQSDAAENVVIFGNPCTMQIILMHWGQFNLPSHRKDKNAPLIEQCTGIKGYKAKEEQRRQLFSLINRDNYIRMKEYVAQLSQDDRQKNSSNFIKLLNNLHCEDGRWIQEFNEKLEC